MVDNYQILLTNLDAHTIDLEPYQHGGANITTLRMVDATSESLTAYAEYMKKAAEEEKKKKEEEEKNADSESNDEENPVEGGADEPPAPEDGKENTEDGGDEENEEKKDGEENEEEKAEGEEEEEEDEGEPFKSQFISLLPVTVLFAFRIQSRFCSLANGADT